MAVAVAGRYAYVGDTSAGLVIVDVSNPATPTMVGSYGAGGDAYGITLSRNYAFVSDYTHGKVNIVNVSNPTTPSLVSTYVLGPGLGNPYGLVVQGNYLYIADQARGRVWIVDISNPFAPSTAGQYAGGINPTGLYVSGGYAYIADASKGLYILDIANPASPSLVGSYDASGQYYGVSVLGNYAYIADHANLFKVIDISNPALPQLVGLHKMPGFPLAITVEGQFAYIADDASGLEIFDISRSGSTIISSGNQGGPFSPSSFQYRLEASNSTVGYSITGVPSWLTASSTSGTVTTSPTIVTLSVNASANSLAVGTYGPSTITFTDTTNSNVVRTITALLTVPAPPQLQVTPATNIAASGSPRGSFSPPSFSPTSFQYQLSTSSGSANYSINGIPSWLNASFTSGTATTSPVTVTFSLQNVSSLDAGTYSATVSFTNTTNGSGNTTRTATLTVGAQCATVVPLPVLDLTGPLPSLVPDPALPSAINPCP